MRNDLQAGLLDSWHGQHHVPVDASLSLVLRPPWLIDNLLQPIDCRLCGPIGRHAGAHQNLEVHLPHWQPKHHRIFHWPFAVADHVPIVPGPTPTIDGVYVVRMDQSLLVKRLQIDLGSRRVTVISDNKKYAIINDVERDAIQVVGRVIWLSRRI